MARGGRDFTDEQFARLPKWAQRHIERIEREVEYHKERTDKAEAGDTDTFVEDSVRAERIGLPPQSRITFALGGSGDWHFDVAARIADRGDGPELEIYSGGGTLLVRQHASNVFAVVPERLFTKRVREGVISGR